jgi:hypothetical protein
MDENKNVIPLEEIHKELDLVQACITRMANNSFLVKGWTYALIAAVIALFGNAVDVLFICGVTIFICICFWYTDAFYLKQERLYRYKYEWIIKMRPEGIRKHLYDLNPYELEMMENKRRYKKGKVSGIEEKLDLSEDDKKNMRQFYNSKETITVMFDKPHTLIWFYGFPIVIAAIVAVYRLIKC